MNFGKSVGSFFSLDIGTTAVRVVELAHSNSGWNLLHYGVKPIDVRLSESTADADRRALGIAITDVINQSGIKSKKVAIGVPSNKMFASVVEIPTVSHQEMNATIKYQAENYVPMRVDEAKIDWAIIGQSVNDPQNTEVLIASVQNTYTEARLDLIEGLGLDVIAIEPDSLAIVRSLLPDGVQDGRMIIDMGDRYTDIILTIGSAPRLIRSVPIGLSTLVRMAKQNLNIEAQQARQLLLKFGLDQNNLEGQIARSVQPAVDQFKTELIKSLKYFTTKYTKTAVGGTLVSGYTSVLRGFPDIIAATTNTQVQMATPWQHVNVPAAAQASLAPISSQLAVAVGLAERTGL